MPNKVALIISPKCYHACDPSCLPSFREKVQSLGVELVELERRELKTRADINRATRKEDFLPALSKPFAEAGDTPRAYVVIAPKRGCIEALDALGQIIEDDSKGLIRSCSVLVQDGIEPEYTKIDLDPPTVLTKDKIKGLVPAATPRLEDCMAILGRGRGDNTSGFTKYDKAVDELGKQRLISIVRSPQTKRNTLTSLINWVEKAVQLNQAAA